MPAGGDWLSLKVDSAEPGRLVVSIPKKIVRLAIRRNRLKRLLREVYHLEKRRFAGNKLHYFRVTGLPPEKLGLEDVRNAVLELLKDIS